MFLSDYLKAGHIVTDLPDGNKFQIIEYLLDVLVANGTVHNRAKALNDLAEREQYLSTGFEHGLAVPHAKTEAVDSMQIAFGIKRKGMDFDSLDGEPTKYVFLLLSPMDTSGPHIKMLATIARNFQDEHLAAELDRADGPEALLRIVKNFK